MNIVVFEDTHADHYYPLTLTRPVWELRAGALSLRERHERFAKTHFGTDRLALFTRGHLAPFLREKHPGLSINDETVFSRKGEILCINAACYPGPEIANLGPDCALFLGDTPLAARFDALRPEIAGSSIGGAIRSSGLKRSEVSADGSKTDAVEFAPFIWSLVNANAKWIEKDFRYFRDAGGPVPETVTILGGRDQLYVGAGVEIEPHAVIDTRKGPVIIEEGARIHPFTYIEGPCHIGKRAVLFGAKVREGVSIGEDCRVGGEVEESIFQAHSNKYHDGFIGHAYVGEWVNLGAMTTNSDLKNNYSAVRVHLPGENTDTGERKVGCFIGDFVKASIGTLLNTGASIGAGAMLVHAGGLTPAHVPPFAWFIRGAVQQRDWLEEFLETARYMMSRRGVDLGPQYADLIRNLYHAHRGEPRIA